VSDEFKLRADTDRAVKAAALLGSDLLQSAFTTLEDAYMTAWRSSPALDTEGREKLFLAINIIGKVRDHLTHVVTNGKLAAAELRTLAEAAERAKKRAPRNS
jgi:hypothetical protein